MSKKTKKTNEMVAYLGKEEMALGPLSSEDDLVKFFFSNGERNIFSFDRRVIPYASNMDSMVDEAKKLIEERKQKKQEEVQ
jgi:hypothetical protein